MLALLLDGREGTFVVPVGSMIEARSCSNCARSCQIASDWAANSERSAAIQHGVMCIYHESCKHASHRKAVQN